MILICRIALLGVDIHSNNNALVLAQEAVVVLLSGDGDTSGDPE